MKTKIISTYCLADKSKLKVGDEVLVGNTKHILTLVENGGCIGERILSSTHILSNAVIFTKDPNRI